MMRATDLISPRYCEEQERLHADPRGYGQRGRKWAARVLAIADQFDAWSILDYGCGQGSLTVALRAQAARSIRLDEYDPAIAGKTMAPGFADLVVCTDVMEHVEADRIANVVKHLHLVTRKALFLVVSLVETAKLLSDGRQAHISLHPRAFWEARFSPFFEVGESFDDVKPDKQWVAVLIPRAGA